MNNFPYVPYSRNIANSQLVGSVKQLSNEEILDLATGEQAEKLIRSNIEYNSYYNYLIDCIHAYCFDFFKLQDPNTQIYAADPINHYCTIELTPEQLEYYCLGDYNRPEIRKKLRDCLNEVVQHPKSKYMITEDTKCIGQPIVITLERKTSGDINRHGGKISNLKNQEDQTPIDKVIIMFYEPYFRNIMTKNPYNYLRWPRNFQAILENEYIEHPEYFNFMLTSQFEKPREIKLTTKYVREHFLYLQAHDNGKGNEMNVDLIKYLKCLKPSALNKQLEFDEYGIQREVYYPRNWWEEKGKWDDLNLFHSHLINEKKLEGFNFKTGKTSYNKTTKTMTVAIYRPPHLETAPDYEPSTDIKPIERPCDEIEFEDSLDDFSRGCYLKYGDIPDKL